MCCQGFIKRVLPFFLTFAVGLFIASFFVTIAAPSFQFKNRGWRNHRQYHQRIESENQQLREENMRLKNEAQQRRGEVSGTFEMNKDGSIERVEKWEVKSVGRSAQ